MQNTYLLGFWRNFKLFWLIIKMEASRYTHYPFEFFFGFINRFTSVFLLALFWYIVGQTSDGNLDSTELLYYYLIVSGLSQLSFAGLGVASSMVKKIKFGLLNGDLVRPIEPFFYQYAKHTGWLIHSFLLAFILMLLGIVLSGGSFNVPYTILAIVNMFLINISFNKLLACVSFYVVEASGIKNAATHTLRFLQGFLIPISLMPESVQTVLLASPFASSLYVPVVLLLGQDIALTSILAGSAWGIGLFVLADKVWKRSLRAYEAVGI